MASRGIKDTARETGALPELRRERQPRGDVIPAAYRREQAARRLIAKHGDPMEFLAKTAMDESADQRTRLDAAKALMPYLYPALKAVELSSPDGTAGVTVQVVSLARTAPERVQLPQAVVVDALPPKPD
jgi:hypothetical protein